MKSIIFIVLVTTVACTPAYQSVSLMDDGSYQFYYETGEETGKHTRTEKRGPDGVVVGEFSYQDPTGDQRVVSYRADDFGYVAKGDVSVPGAPKGQFPAEEQPVDEKPEESTVEYAKDDQEDKGKDSEEKPEEDGAHEDSSQPSRDKAQEDEDDAKVMKFQEPEADAPPDGFPVGFFTHNFQGLRRLPDPVKEEPKEEKKSHGGKREEIHQSRRREG